jgi:hypothetical protein
MHNIEPFWKWREIYTAESDEHSPFFGKTYNEFQFSDKIYNYYIHPQWDYFGSDTLYLKLLYCNYKKNIAIIEFIGEWNDCLNNDIMFLKRDFIDILIENGISKFILIGENILEFFADIEDYYAEWFDDIKDNEGYIVAVNFRAHIIEEMEKSNLQYYIEMYQFEEDAPLNWRQFKPLHLVEFIEQNRIKKLTY